MTASPYDQLAGEYYDPERHPTCDDLRRASAGLLDGFFDLIAPPRGLLLELGAGRSLLMERWSARGWPPRQVMLTDASAAMLAHSLPFGAGGAWLAVADATRLPLADGRADFICAILGDPYNSAATWAEVRRVLPPSGICIFTTPAYDWAQHFRARCQRGRDDVAAFLIDRTTEVYVPSHVLAESEQRALLAQSGLRVVDARHVSRAALPGGAVSPKLRLDGFSETAPVITGYLIQHAD